MSKLKQAWKNEYIKSIVFLAIILIGIVAFWMGLRFFLRTDYPLLAVASESMVPTLNVGDLIIVQGGLNVSDITAEYGTGDVIVFHKPGDPDELIVHRAVEKNDDSLRTKGDANAPIDNWSVFDSHLVGRVVGTVPYLGHIPLFVRTTTGVTIIVILIVILILLEFIIPAAKKAMKTEHPEEETDALDGSL
ncbi:MAG: signal peptidase I [Candidatus Bathyarchaeota archaeon]|nr:MAG: signal peptidase I [Candidatus Bathyarchaeota archaeon]